MMTHPLHPAGPTGRAVKPAHSSHAIGIVRMVGLETAAGMLGGQEPLADALGIKVRSLRAKFTADRGISNEELLATATALDARAARIAAHAAKLRAAAGGV